MNGIYYVKCEYMSILLAYPRYRHPATEISVQQYGRFTLGVMGMRRSTDFCETSACFLVYITVKLSSNYKCIKIGLRKVVQIVMKTFSRGLTSIFSIYFECSSVQYSIKYLYYISINIV